MRERRGRRRRLPQQSYFLYHLPYLVAQNTEEAELGEGDHAETQDEQQVRCLPEPVYECDFATTRVWTLAGLAHVHAGHAAALRPVVFKVPGTSHPAALEVSLKSVPLLAESWLLTVVHLRTRDRYFETRYSVCKSIRKPQSSLWPLIKEAKGTNSSVVLHLISAQSYKNV